MDETGKISNRKVLPRWRDAKRLLSSEIVSASNLMPAQKPSDDLMTFYYYVWQASPTIENALDVLSYAYTSVNKALAYGPAEQILRTKGVLPGIYELADRIRNLQPSAKDDILGNVSQSLPLIISAQRSKVHEARKRLIDEPRNGLLWLELARLHLSLGNKQHADDAMRKALATTPDNRLILRGAARLYVHLGREDEAHFYLKNSDALKIDPWVQSAEIAVASIARKSSISLRAAKTRVENTSVLPVYYSELAVAVGTEEIQSGNTKLGKKLIVRGLENPTENSVAQALWVRDKVRVDVSPELIRSTPNTFEAQSSFLLQSGDYSAALSGCMLWHFDEFFSVAPSVQGSFIATTFLEEYDGALRLVELGQKANPNNPHLLNNGIFALAKLNRIPEAREKMDKLLAITGGAEASPTIIATRGLLEFGAGRFAEGRELYAQAATMAGKTGSKDLEFRVKFHWFREEVAARQLSFTEVRALADVLDRVAESKKYHLSDLTRKTWKIYKAKILEECTPDAVGYPHPQLTFDV